MSRARARAKGIQPFQVQSVDKDEIGVKLVWSAMTIAYKDKAEEILPRVMPANLATLEQDVIGPIYRLTREHTPLVAVFGPTDPSLGFGPRGPRDRTVSEALPCRPCSAHGGARCPLGHHRCLRDLPVARVRDVVHDVLTKEALCV